MSKAPSVFLSFSQSDLRICQLADGQFTMCVKNAIKLERDVHRDR